MPILTLYGCCREDGMKLTPFSHRPEFVIDTEKKSLMNRVIRWDAAGARTVTINPDCEKRRDHGRRRDEDTLDEAGAHLENLRSTAASVNRALADRGSPYRFYVFSEGDEAYINLVVLNPDGSVSHVQRKSITHTEFSDLVRQLERGEGLFLELVG